MIKIKWIGPVGLNLPGYGLSEEGRVYIMTEADGNAYISQGQAKPVSTPKPKRAEK